MIRNAKVNLRPGVGTVEVDGAQLTCVVRCTIEGGVNEVPQLTLELRMHQGEIDGQMRITIPPKTAATLVALGWTAPDGQPIDSPEQLHAWEHACGTLNSGTPETSGCCQDCRQEPSRYDREHSPRYVLVQVGGPNAAA